MEPLFVAQPGGMRWHRALAWVIGAILGALTIVVAVTASVTAALSSFIGLIVLFLFVWAILPRRYEVWPERLRIVFPLWGWDLKYESIETVRAGHWYEAYGFMGLRFATAPSQTVTILRRNANLITRPNVVISPRDRETFLRQLQRAMGR